MNGVAGVQYGRPADLDDWVAIVGFDAGFRQPVEVVEAAVDVAALIERRTLVAKDIPDVGIVIQVENGRPTDEAEEIGRPRSCRWCAHTGRRGTNRAGRRHGSRG